jgi:hypothetical protein
VASPLATQTPARYGYAPFGRHGRPYKVALVVRPGATVTVTIGARARGHAVIDNPAGEQRGLGGVTSATYHACRKPGGFFAQGFVFTRPAVPRLRAAQRDSRRPGPGPSRCRCSQATAVAEDRPG